jgi:hypothetical protein
MPVSLNKDSLTPGQIYNVSVSFKESGKTVDNLRFFQTAVPKVFTSSMSPYSTLSTIENKVSRKDNTANNGSEPGPRTSQIQTMNISTSRVGGTPGAPSVTDQFFEFKLNSGAPATMYVLTGFTNDKFKFLNDMSGVKTARDIVITLPYSFFAPNVVYSRAKAKWTGPKGELDLINYFIKNKTVQDNTFGTGAVVNYYGGSYKAPTVTSTYTRTSTIRTNLRNPSVLESLYFESQVKDFVYFFISSSDKNNAPFYYFRTSSDITPGTTANKNIVGKIGAFSASGPKQLTVADFNNLSVDDYASGANALFFTGTNTAAEDFGVGNVYVRFAIARYVLDAATNTVDGDWLPVNNDSGKILSSIERLDGY